VTRGAVLILGARSDIGRAVAYRFARDGYAIQLAAKEAKRLAEMKSDIELRHHVPVSLHDFDALAIDTHGELISSLPVLPEIAVCAVGYMGKQVENERDVSTASFVFRTNFEGPASVLAELANCFERRGSGTLVGISSVAGQRGRASNYIYGSAKAGLTSFLSGLRNRLANKGIHVVTVLPGFVKTRMTEEMKLPPILTAKPIEVADAISRAVQCKRNVIYVRPAWRLITLVIQMIPERIFKRTSL
jgi:decaprenylphospho-beta-D-erythro-pentofuranosid-2-ulose 2-reductase